LKPNTVIIVVYIDAQQPSWVRRGVRAGTGEGEKGPGGVLGMRTKEEMSVLPWTTQNETNMEALGGVGPVTRALVLHQLRL